MAILRRHKSTIYGLQADLDNLGATDTSEAGLRAQGDATLQGKIDAEATTRVTEHGVINTTVSGHTTAIDALENDMDVVNGDSTTVGSIEKAKADALAFTTARETAITTAYQTYANTAESDAIATAQTYTNTRETAITSAYQTYADTAESDAKAYTDTRETAITSAYHTYADTAESDAIATAQTYTNTRETAITSAYQTYANTAEADALSAANTYTDTKVLTINAAVSDKMSKASNLSDVTNVVTARTNLDVYSTTETDDAINAAKLALGTNYSVANSTAKTALTGLTVGDNVFVTDDGDLKWANYKVTAVTDGGGDTSTFQKIMDEDIYLNSITAEAVKAAYEGNANTNAFTDAEKLQLVTNTNAIATINDDSLTDGSFAKGDADTLFTAKAYTDTRETAITTAYKTYADTAESDAISTSQTYTNARETAITTAYQTYANTAESDAIATAQTYTNTRETAITSAYQTYADTAEADAKTYTDTRETAITSAYHTYADTAESDAIATAQTYTDGQVTILNTSVATKLAKASNLSDLNNVAAARTNLGVYSTSAVDTAISTATSGILNIKSESIVVSGDLITLTFTPANGVILNFNTVRYIDENSNSFDIPVSVTATAGGKEFELNGDSSNQFDTKTIRVQYMYVA